MIIAPWWLSARHSFIDAKCLHKTKTRQNKELKYRRKNIVSKIWKLKTENLQNINRRSNLLERWFGIDDDLWFLATRYVQVKIWRISGLPLLNVFPMASFLSDNIWIWQGWQSGGNLYTRYDFVRSDTATVVSMYVFDLLLSVLIFSSIINFTFVSSIEFMWVSM